MQTIRDSITNIPDAINNLLISSYAALPNPLLTFAYDNTNINESQSGQSSISEDEVSDRSQQAIPHSLIKEQWQLVLDQDATVQDLENAITLCKQLVLDTDECTIERKWLVRHLIELRYRLNELQDFIDDPKCTVTNVKVILGHHFVVRSNKLFSSSTTLKQQSPQQPASSSPSSPPSSDPTTGTMNLASASSGVISGGGGGGGSIATYSSIRQYCDHCSGIIWSVVQASYICTDCFYCVHHKCLQNVIRICAHIITSEKKEPSDQICPEIGVAFQLYKCAECQTPLNFKKAWIEPRLCDYSGLYYCQTCHWNDTCSVPARIIHNWDFTPKKVCRASLQELNLYLNRPVINLELRNPKLFIYVQNLSQTKKLRMNLNYMKRYLIECRTATTQKLIESHIGIKRHLIQTIDGYSLADLIAIENGTLIDLLNKWFDLFDRHIRMCELCLGKGYICEICDNIEVIFPYDDGSIVCEKCEMAYHRACLIRKNMQCPKCKRIEQRRSEQVPTKNPHKMDSETDAENDAIQIL